MKKASFRFACGVTLLIAGLFFWGRSILQYQDRKSEWNRYLLEHGALPDPDFDEVVVRTFRLQGPDEWVVRFRAGRSFQATLFVFEEKNHAGSQNSRKQLYRQVIISATSGSPEVVHAILVEVSECVDASWDVVVKTAPAIEMNIKPGEQPLTPNSLRFTGDGQPQSFAISDPIALIETPLIATNGGVKNVRFVLKLVPAP